MKLVLLTALGVGGATVVGGILGFLFKRISERFHNIMLAFSAGVMLSSAVIGLILPSLEDKRLITPFVTVIGIFTGAFLISLFDKLVFGATLPLSRGEPLEERGEAEKRAKALLFVAAIAIHNLPEGIAAGVGAGSENLTAALVIASGIALQNLPEGMIVIFPMLSVGYSKKRTFLLAALSGLVEVVGTFIGYFAVSFASMILPFALAFAGGTMLYVVVDEMLPSAGETKSKSGAYAFLFGFCLMLLADFFI